MFLPTPGALVANRFRLRHAIGKGGMGQVWEAHDRELDSPCAVKFIVDHMAQDPEARLRIVREARAVARLRSPHVVTILGVGEHEDAMYLAMELLEGETLAIRLERVLKLDTDTTLVIVEQIAQVLDKAHSHGIVHRDLKPDNLWLSAGPKPFIKVLDFGVAKTTLSVGSNQTVSGALMGTPQYMSPEQASGDREVDHRSDLWALGIIAMECLSGRRPFESHGLGDLLNKIMNAAPPPVQSLDASLPGSLGSWWQRALARDPELRFHSAAELLQALRFGLTAAPVAAVSPILVDTDRGTWTAAPVPPRVPTLVTNVTPMPPSGSSAVSPASGSPASGLPSSEPLPLGTFRVARPVEPGASMGPVSNTTDVERPGLGPRGRLWIGASAGAFALLVAALWILRGPPGSAGVESSAPALAQGAAPPSSENAPLPSVQDVAVPPVATPPAPPQTTTEALTPVAPGNSQSGATAAAADPVVEAAPATRERKSARPRKPPRKPAQTPPPTKQHAPPPAQNARLKARLGF